MVLTNPPPGYSPLPEELPLSEAEVRDGLTIHRFPFRAAIESGEPALFTRALALVSASKRAFQPDLVHVAISDPIGFFHLRTLSTAKAATSIGVQCSVISLGATGEGLFQRLAAEARVIIANSAMTEAELHRLLPGREHDILRISPGFAEGHFLAVPPPDESLPLTRLLFAGRLIPDKGVDVLLEAFARLHAIHPELTLTLAGTGPSEADLIAQACHAGVRDACRFLGPTSQQGVAHLMGEADIVVVPSNYQESFGLVAAEAAAAGRPVVASATGGLLEIVADGETGLLVRQGDVLALTAALARLLENSALARDMGRRARLRAISRFSHGAMTKAYRGAFARAIATPGERT